jgi:hypothetical protein
MTTKEKIEFALGLLGIMGIMILFYIAIKSVWIT